MRGDLDPTLAGSAGQSMGKLRRINIAIGSHVTSADNSVKIDKGKEFLSLLSRYFMQIQVERSSPTNLSAYFFHSL